MAKDSDRLHSELLETLAVLPPRPDRMLFLRALQAWLRTAVARWRPEQRAGDSLDFYATLDLDRFPIDRATLDPLEEIRQLRAVPPTSMAVFAMRLGEIFWHGITVESGITCPRCGGPQLRFLEDPLADGLVLECEACGWAQTEDGKQRQGPPNLRPPTRLDRQRAPPRGAR